MNGTLIDLIHHLLKSKIYNDYIFMFNPFLWNMYFFTKNFLKRGRTVQYRRFP